MHSQYLSSLFIVLNLILSTNQLDINIPSNGIGPIVITAESPINWYNDQSLLFVFDLECMSGQEQFIIVSILSIYQSCLSLINEYINTYAHSYVFFNLLCSIYDIQEGEYKNLTLNYNELCIEYITYEPIFDTQSTTQSLPVNIPSFTCVKQSTDYFKSWALDLLESKNRNDYYLYPIFNNNSFDKQRKQLIQIHILDSGIQASHPEFHKNQILPIYSNNELQYKLYNGHGTSIAGIITGINYGATKNFTIYDYNVCNLHGDADRLSCFMSSILYALHNIYLRLSEGDNVGNIAIINLAFSGPVSETTTDIYDFYFQQIQNNNGIIVVAAGNDKTDACNKSPAYSSNVITVGSFDRNRDKSYWSNYGVCVDMFAPGESIYSSISTTDEVQYEYQDGTSMSAAYITGIIANILYINPLLSYNETKNILLNNGISIDNDECSNQQYECKSVLYQCPSTSISRNEEEDDLDGLDITLIVLGIIVAFVIIFCIVAWTWRRRHFHRKRRERNKLNQNNDKEIDVNKKNIHQSNQIVETDEEIDDAEKQILTKSNEIMPCS